MDKSQISIYNLSVKTDDMETEIMTNDIWIYEDKYTKGQTDFR